MRLSKKGDVMNFQNFFTDTVLFSIEVCITIRRQPTYPYIGVQKFIKLQTTISTILRFEHFTFRACRDFKGTVSAICESNIWRLW